MRSGYPGELNTIPALLRAQWYFPQDLVPLSGAVGWCDSIISNHNRVIIPESRDSAIII